MQRTRPSYLVSNCALNGQQIWTYIVVIHSRACTVPCHTTPFLEPFPPLPQIWIPLMSRFSTDFPAEITSEFLGYAAARSVIHWWWSAIAWYELNQVALGASPAERWLAAVLFYCKFGNNVPAYTLKLSSSAMERPRLSCMSLVSTSAVDASKSLTCEGGTMTSTTLLDEGWPFHSSS